MARAQAAEGASLLGGLKTGVAEWYATNGNLPTTGQINAVTTGKYISGIALAGNTYTATFRSTPGSVNAKLAGETIGMTFDTSGSTSFTWTCSMDQAVRPSVCPAP
ncbi:pilin [Methylicorpusculum oleiharenae]|nr:pilin [Methylicorpusculum oleiharenae]MCD2453034.1 pilin [Methylicorpusculum oleiharenae]